MKRPQKPQIYFEKAQLQILRPGEMMDKSLNF